LRARHGSVGVMTDRAADRESPGAVMAELRGVSKTYGSGGSAVLAVEGVDLSVRAGEIDGVNYGSQAIQINGMAYVVGTPMDDRMLPIH